MEASKDENQQLKEFLAEAIEIANFTVSGHGFFISHKLWALKMHIDKSSIAAEDDKLLEVIRASQ